MEFVTDWWRFLFPSDEDKKKNIKRKLKRAQRDAKRQTDGLEKDENDKIKTIKTLITGNKMEDAKIIAHQVIFVQQSITAHRKISAQIDKVCAQKDHMDSINGLTGIIQSVNEVIYPTDIASRISQFEMQKDRMEVTQEMLSEALSVDDEKEENMNATQHAAEMLLMKLVAEIRENDAASSHVHHTENEPHIPSLVHRNDTDDAGLVARMKALKS